MSSFTISIPGKSFLAGEYLAVQRGPSLVFASEPRFELHAVPGSGQLQGIHPDSPAGKLIADQSSFFKNYDLTFKDPHQGRGGWGASTAQFLASFVMGEWRESCAMESLKSVSFSRLLDSYWRFAWNGQGQRPSGADMIGQYTGALTYFDPQGARVSKHGWPFHSLEFALIPTGHKLSTHDHLQTLGDFSTEALQKAMTEIFQGLQTVNEAQFAAGIRHYGAALAALKFVAPATAQLLQKFQQCPAILASKGCGAMGADVVMVVFEKNNKDLVSKFLQQQQLTILVTSKNLSAGLDVFNRG